MIKNKKVYIVFRDVPHEFGEIYEVCATQKLAETVLKEIELEFQNSTSPFKKEEWEIQEWDILDGKR
jgi:hypothetical protein